MPSGVRGTTAGKAVALMDIIGDVGPRDIIGAEEKKDGRTSHNRCYGNLRNRWRYRRGGPM